MLLILDSLFWPAGARSPKSTISNAFQSYTTVEKLCSNQVSPYLHVTPSEQNQPLISPLTLSTCGANLLGSILSPGTAAANPQLFPIQSAQLDSGSLDIASISITAVPDFPAQTPKFFSRPVVLHHYINSGLAFGLIQCRQLNLALGAENGGPADQLEACVEWVSPLRSACDSARFTIPLAFFQATHDPEQTPTPPPHPSSSYLQSQFWITAPPS